ncbi:MAG: tRNA (N6-threonylcarbamoyladenosine(37)-N6)-methyltransferase TrmO [Clostridia bacterium]|nr:tRNA (N6-threonylcarbamoyladenosine(37)-N6)-methyltransferase TrmO [Clostridia bacterium]
MSSFTVSPIGYMRSELPEKFGVPRQSGRAPSLLSHIVLIPPYDTEEAFREIEGFSHIWLLFDFSLARKDGWSATVRPPRLGGNKRVGVFASRSPFRPNHIGLSCVKLVGLERTKDGLCLKVLGADLLDGTPILDIKPYLPFADCIPTATGGYAAEREHYRLKVDFPLALQAQIPEEKREGLIECLADDPRPSYHDDITRIYGMAFGGYQIRFRVERDTLYVVDVQKTM